jgi:hypothetical protein
LDTDDKAVTVAHLQTCLKQNVKAKVIAGKRLAIDQNSEAVSSQKPSVYHNMSTNPGKPSFKHYQSGATPRTS